MNPPISETTTNKNPHKDDINANSEVPNNNTTVKQNERNYLSEGPGPFIDYPVCSLSCGGGDSKVVLKNCSGEPCTTKYITCNVDPCQGLTILNQKRKE